MKCTPCPASSARVATLDGLRGCAVLMVLVHHYVGLSPLLDAPPGAFRSYVRAALGLMPTGVDLFFVLSGFLIGGILIDHRESPRLLKAFYFRRFLRIVPVAWLCILSSIVLYRLTPNRGAAIPWLVGFTFTTNFFLASANQWVLSPLTAQWSLGIEEQFYLFFPWLLREWPRRLMPWLGPGLIIGALGVRILGRVFFPGSGFTFTMLTFCRLDSLGAGFAATWLVRSSVWPHIRQSRRFLWIALAALAALLGVLVKCQFRSPQQMHTWGLTALALFYGTTLLIAYDPQESPVRKLFTASWLRLYGKFSYFIYLFQGLLARPLVMLLFHGRWQDTSLSTWPETIAAILIMLVPAALSWYLLESPLLRLARRWQYE